MPIPLLAIAVYLVSLTGVPVKIWDAAVTVRLNKRLDAIRTAGDPVTMGELAKMYSEPPLEKNTAPLYEKAFEKMKALERELAAEKRRLPIVGKGETPELHPPIAAPTLQAIGKYLERNGEVLALFGEATELDSCRFRLDFSRGTDGLVPHLRCMAEGTKLHALAAVYHTERGDVDRAVTNILRGFRMAKAIENEPVTLSGLVRIACFGKPHWAVKRLVNRTVVPDAAMKRLEAELERTARSQTLPRILAGDRCMLMDYYRNYTEAPRDADFIKEIANAPVRQKAAMLIIPRAYFKCDQLAFVDMMDACMAAVRGPRPQGLIEAFHLTEEVNGEIPPYYMLARTTPRHIGYVIENTQIHIARCDTARVVLACLRRRSAKGALPDTLGALVPDYIKSVPLDPFVGGQLRYKRTPRGFVVYALGKNKRDDGGDTEGFVDVGCRVRLMKPDF